MLKLQDLTESDIRRYVSDSRTLPLESSCLIHNPRWITSTIDEIVEKAGGVFLWVKLAVRDQIEGIGNDDSLEQLR